MNIYLFIYPPDVQMQKVWTKVDSSSYVQQSILILELENNIFNIFSLHNILNY